MPDQLDILPAPMAPALSATGSDVVVPAEPPVSPSEGSTAPATAPETTEQPPSQPSDDEAPGEDSSARSRKGNITDRFRLQRDEARAQLRQALDTLALVQARQQAQPQTPAQPQPTQPQGDPRPARADFDDPDAYTDAVATWTARREVARTLQQMAQMNAQLQTAQAVNQRVTSYRARVEEARAKHADFSEVAEAPDLPITDLMAQAIMRSEVGPDIQYHLGKNPAEARRIAELSARDPYAAVLAIGALETKMSAETKPVSKAPPPIRSKVGSKEAVAGDPYEKSMEEFASHWREREKANRARR
jgi:hypothetical protein